VIATLHDANQAERFADYSLLLEGAGDWQFGPTRDVITAESLTRVYRTPMTELPAPAGASSSIPDPGCCLAASVASRLKNRLAEPISRCPGKQ